MATVQIEYFGMEGIGKTVTEAKRDAGSKIEKAMQRHYQPMILSWRGNTKLLWATTLGWRSCWLTDNGQMKDEIYGGSGDNSDKDDEIRSCLSCLAQSGWKPEDGDSCDLLDKHRLATHAMRSDFRSWVKFQLRYRVAKEKGFNDCDCHAYACGAMFNPELLAMVDAA